MTARSFGAAGELAKPHPFRHRPFVRQHGLAHALFQQIVTQNAEHASGTRSLASVALMQSNLDLAATMMWNAIDTLPRDSVPPTVPP